jgi:hypothetical protein
VAWLRDVGQSVALPPQGDADTARVGFAIVTADTAERARSRTADLRNRLTLTVDPPRGRS